jgi:hypothetical protein
MTRAMLRAVPISFLVAVPYVASWAAGIVFASLAVRWLPRHPRSSWRYGVALLSPIALYVIGVLIGTDQPVLAGIRGISFAVITLIWLGWRRTPNQSASSSANRALVQRKVVGTVVVIAVAAVVAGGVGAVIPPTSYARFVLRDTITPPFDPLQYASPLSAFRYYSKTAKNVKLFTVSGLKKNDVIRLATMDSYTGQLWNVVGTDVSADGSGSFDLVGTKLPTTPALVPSSPRTISLTVDAYKGVWVPLVGNVSALETSGSAAGEELHYNSTTGTAALTGSGRFVTQGAKFALKSEVPQTPAVATLEKASTADVNLPTAYSIDVIVSQAQKHEGSGSSYAKLVALQKYLLTGYLSHGSKTSPSVSGHGANRMIDLFPPRGVLVGDAEQYASAFALEARALGMPARVVMGFKPKVAPGEKSVAVLGSDVTAWDEVDFQGIGWVSFFPTPTRTGKPPKTPPPPVSQTVNQSRQPNRVGQPQNNVLSPVAIKKPKTKPTGFVLPAWVLTTAGIVAIPLVLYFVPLLVIAWIKRRRRGRRRNTGTGDTRVAGAWDELTDSLGELGVRIPRRTTRIQTALSIQSQLKMAPASHRPGLVEFAATTDEAVFAGESVPDAEVTTAWTTAFSVIAEARGSLPRWRRWMSRFRVRSKRGLPPALTSIDTTAVTDRVKELVNR